MDLIKRQCDTIKSIKEQLSLAEQDLNYADFEHIDSAVLTYDYLWRKYNALLKGLQNMIESDKNGLL